jgi:3-dehydroquinate synthase
MESQKLSYSRTSTSEIILGNDIFKEVASRVHRMRAAKHCAILTNETVAKWYLQPILAELRSKGIKACEIVLPDGEKFKTLDSIATILAKLCEDNLDRNCPMIALGGGVICDLGGFTASIFKRGIPLVLMPTSLLAMVDASIGGKNGINLSQGKNLAGTFYQPVLTAIDVSVLRTLPLSQLAYGIVEAVKHGAIADAAYFRFIHKNIDAIKTRQITLLQRLIRRSIHIKKSFVAEDELDQGVRAHLNLGHTFGHALEAAGNYIRLHHGEAVGIGMLMALKAAKSIGKLEEDYSDSLAGILSEFSLPTRIPVEFDRKELLKMLAQDKKKAEDSYRFILPESLGKTFVHKVNADKIEDFFLNACNI